MALKTTVPRAVNPVRPFRSYGGDHDAARRQRGPGTTGLLTSAKITPADSGTVTLNYTLSRNRTDSTSDRDSVDIPQNPADPDSDYADARTDRRHIFDASFTYELPFFRNSGGFPKAVSAAGRSRASSTCPRDSRWLGSWC